MKGRLCVQMFSFDQPFQPYQKDDFAKVIYYTCILWVKAKHISEDWNVLAICVLWYQVLIRTKHPSIYSHLQADIRGEIWNLTMDYELYIHLFFNLWSIQQDFMKDPNVISNLRMISGDKWTVVGMLQLATHFLKSKLMLIII